MKESRKVTIGLLCLVAGSLGALITYMIVNDLPKPPFNLHVDHYAIVIDAGSTKTRSKLFQFKIDIDSIEHLERDFIEFEDQAQLSPAKLRKLNQFVKVRELSSCKNGIAMTEVRNVNDARKLITRCDHQYREEIRDHNFSGAIRPIECSVDDKWDFSDSQESSNEIDDQSRTHSISKIYLGATAGMRSLADLRPKLADDVVHLLDEAIVEDASREPVAEPKMEPGFVGILTGSEEAAFSWTSVNFFCDQLRFAPIQRRQQQQQDENNAKRLTRPKGTQLASSHMTIGIVELGGSSGQIAYQLPTRAADNVDESDESPFEYRLNLFGVDYPMKARSDECIGMEQARLRAKILQIRRALKGTNNDNQYSTLDDGTKLEIYLHCWSPEHEETLTRDELLKISREPCLSGPTSSNQELDPIQVFLANHSRIGELRLTGAKPTHGGVASAKSAQCDALVADLLEPAICAENFELCLSQPIKGGPPIGVPFVAVSALSKVVSELNLAADNLSQIDTEHEGLEAKLVKKIDRDLNAHSIDYLQFKDRMETICKTPLHQLKSEMFSKIPEAYRNETCYNLVYIERILTHFYGFAPVLGKWKQLKFPFANTPGHQETSCQRGPEVGWSLGLLLNATSQDLAKDPSARDSFRDTADHHYYYKTNGRSILYVPAAGLLLVTGVLLFRLTGRFLLNGDSSSRSFSCNNTKSSCDDCNCSVKNTHQLETITINSPEFKKKNETYTMSY